MSYCRFSSENGYCEVYVYESVDGEWITHVPRRRWPEVSPPDPYLEFSREWREDHPLIEIDHPEAGSVFRHETARECAENLIRLKNEGFRVTQRAIDVLLAENEGGEDNDTKQ